MRKIVRPRSSILRVCVISTNSNWALSTNLILEQPCPLWCVLFGYWNCQIEWSMFQNRLIFIVARLCSGYAVDFHMSIVWSIFELLVPDIMRIPRNAYISWRHILPHSAYELLFFGIFFIFSSCFFIRVTHNHINHLIKKINLNVAEIDVSVFW